MDHNKQFDEDFKLKHVKLNNVQYFDTEKEKLFDATLELFGHCYELATFQKGKPYQNIKGISSKDFELEYKVLESDGLYITVDIKDDDTVIKMLFSDFEMLKTHYAEINIDFEKQREQFRDEVISTLPSLLNNDELKMMALNFISEMPSIFLSSGLIVGIEQILESRDNIGRLLFLSHENMRNTVSMGDELQGALLEYLKNEFDMFTEVVREKLDNTGSAKSMYCTHLFLYYMTIEFYSQRWNNEYKNEFTDIDSLNLADAISRYCSIETIEHDNANTSGVFVYYLIDNQKFENNRNFIECNSSFSDLLEKQLEAKKFKNFVNKISNSSPAKKKYTIDDVDLMAGQEFEQFIAILFSKLGYEAKVTKASGDQGIDIIATKNGTKIGIQAKCYSGTVGNGAIQEVVAGKNYYRLEKGIVVTNNFFTESAQQLAQANSIILWDRNILKEKIGEILNSSSD